MRKLIVSAWISLDGVFDADTMPTWYAPYDSAERQEVIRRGMESADAFVFGRVTYDMLAPYWSSLKANEMGVAAKLNEAPKYVVSSKLAKADWQNTTIIQSNVVEAIRRLKDQPGKEVRIDGSATLVASLMDANVIDEISLLVHPVLTGTGKRFFRDGMHAALKLVSTRTLANGVIHSVYSR